jgi:hypothetical protein
MALIDHRESSSQKQNTIFTYVTLTVSGLIVSLIAFQDNETKQQENGIITRFTEFLGVELLGNL